ncbi:MAG TPA: hypothetical protein VMF58_15345 [Rhizomicrobium sp.]|nr:hypothetical protein [Rhizomicrobium sp.]
MKASPILAILIATPAFAQDGGDVFTDAASNAKVHAASGFVCPSRIGMFDRDAVGERDPKASADFCAYSALDGVYGTITLIPLGGPYDPKTALVPEFQEEEATGGKVIGEKTGKFGGATVYSRSYSTLNLGDTHYRVQFAASAVGQWAVQVTMEYASPRDDAVKQDFLNAVYDEALHKLGGAK